MPRKSKFPRSDIKGSLTAKSPADGAVVAVPKPSVGADALVEPKLNPKQTNNSEAYRQDSTQNICQI